MPQPTNARPATPLESAEWEKFKAYYHGFMAPAVLRAKTAAEIANQAQAVINTHKIGGFVFDAAELQKTQALLARANMIGRYITDVESGKYAIRIAHGDIDVLAPADMPAAEYQPDIYPLEAFGVAPIIWVLAVGAVLVTGLWMTSHILESDAKRIEADNEKQVLAADREMMKQPDPARRDWIDMKKATTPAAREAGILSKIFGSEAAGAIGGGVGLGVVLIALALAFSMRRK